MRLEFEKANLPVVVVGVNADSAVAYQSDFVSRRLPLFQDQADVNVFELQGGQKDDFFVYDKQGTLAAYLPITGPRSTNLTTTDGYAYVRTVMSALFLLTRRLATRSRR